MWLERLVTATRERVERGYYDRRPPARLGTGPSLRAAVERAYPAIVAEVKPGRPGEATRVVDVEALARAYAAGGACGISVLTDPDHFGGSLENLVLAGRAGLPLLFKDFVIDERQLDAAAAWGASAVLAIVRVHQAGLAALSYEDLVAGAHARELEVLAEVHADDELDVALAASPDLVGVNQRDLDTLEMDAERTASVLAGRKLGVPVLHLSGVEDAAGVARALKAGAQGVLVGSSLMRAKDPARAVHALTDLEGVDA